MKLQDQLALDGFPNSNEKIIGLNRDCFVTINSDNSYVTEFKIPLTSRGAEDVYMGAQVQQSTVVFNYIDTVPYGMWRGATLAPRAGIYIRALGTEKSSTVKNTMKIQYQK